MAKILCPSLNGSLKNRNKFVAENVVNAAIFFVKRRNGRLRFICHSYKSCDAVGTNLITKDIVGLHFERITDGNIGESTEGRNCFELFACTRNMCGSAFCSRVC